MPNMSYCKFQNTLPDLRDCFDSMDDELSPEEDRARRKLIKLCHEIAGQYPVENEDAA